MKNWLKKFEFKNDKTLLYAFIALGVVALLMNVLTPKAEKPVEKTAENFDVDTMIPSGYMLVPVQLSNAESLASLSGQFALVDLYSVGDKNKKGAKVASSVKLLRAPLNPQQFAVLLREEESSQLATMDGPLFAALKNPADIHRPALPKIEKSNLVIHYGE